MGLVYFVLGLSAVAAIARGGGEWEALSVSKRASKDECDAITLNIQPLLGSCGTDLRTCLDASKFGAVSFIQAAICPVTKSVRENIYDILVACEGQAYADLVYAGVCGNTTLSNGDVVLCTDAILSVNDGSAAKAACCSDSSGSGSGKSNCASELQRLADDLGCCTATILFQFYLMECEGRLAGVFLANSVDQPPLCNYTVHAGTPIPAASGATVIALLVGMILSLM